MIGSALSGTGSLVRLALRRDRLVVPAVGAAFVLVVATSATATTDLYPTQASRAVAAEAVNSTPALVGLYGPVFDVTSRGALSFFKLTVFGAAFVALLSILLVVRHTRADEEAGRRELVAAGSVGRDAPLVAALVVAAGSSVLVGLLTAAAVLANGFTVGDAAGFGAAWAATGVAFAGVGAVTAQLSSSARTTRAAGITVLGIAYVLRGAGDSADAGPLVWCSPLGWAEEVRPFAGNRPWPVLLLLVTAAALVLLAVVVQHRRDLGAGLLPDRPGPARGSLGSALALARQLHRATTIGWAVAITGLGLLLGNLVTHLGGFFNNPSVERFIVRLGGPGALSDAFLSTDFGFVALAVTGYGLSVLSRMRAEEATGRMEELLAAGAGRARWIAGHVLVALAGSTVILALGGAAAGLAHALGTGEPRHVWSDLGALLVRAPAVWVLLGATVLLFGLAGRWAAYGWVLLVLALMTGEIGDVMGLPGWVRGLSPYAHVPLLPGGSLEGAPLGVLLVLGAALAGAGVLAFTRRDAAVG